MSNTNTTSIRAALIALLLSGCCPFRQWSRTDTVLEATFGAELAVDAAQTGHIVAECQEYNPIVGPCGERVPFPVYQLAVAVLHVAVAAALPPRWREIFQGVTIGVEGHTIYFNAIVPDAPPAMKP